MLSSHLTKLVLRFKTIVADSYTYAIHCMRTLKLHVQPTHTMDTRIKFPFMLYNIEVCNFDYIAYNL